MPRAVPGRIFAIFGCLLLLSCTAEMPADDARPALQARQAPATPPSAAPPLPIAGPAIVSAPDSRSAAAEIFKGSGSFIGRRVPSRRSASIDPAGEVSLNFLNADVRDVVRTVLGDLLKLNYVIDPAAQGTVTIQTNRPIARAAVLPALENALRMTGLGLIESDGGYKVVPAGDAPRLNGISQAVAARSAGTVGFGVEIVPLKYIGAREMQRVLEPIAPSGGIVQVDAARNLMVIGGTLQERAAILDDIALFDVDWLAGVSFAIFPLRAASSKTMIADLNQIIGGRDGPMGGVVRLVPIERMNAILAITSQPSYLDELRVVIERLDHGGESADRRLYVYYVQNGRAADLAAVLGKALGSAQQAPARAAAPSAPSSSGDPIIQPPITSGGFASAGAPSLGRPSQSAAATPSPPDPLAPPDPPGAEASKDGIRAGGLAGVSITADTTNNALLVLASAQEYALVEQALRRLDIPPMQVLLEAAVAEVTLTDDLRYGVQYYFQAGHNQIVNSSGGAAAVAPTYPGFAYLFSSGQNINVVLNALSDVTAVRVLSAPKLLVLNNQTATLSVGNQVPVVTQSAVAVQSSGAPIVNSIEYRDTGVILKVVPRVNAGGQVAMDVSQEVSDVGSSGVGTLNSPTFVQRKISSTVAVQDGETVALGGLISDHRTDERSGIPLLQDIPYLGALFRTTTDDKVRTELLVLITPHVVQGVQRAREITEELRRALPATGRVFDLGR